MTLSNVVSSLSAIMSSFSVIPSSFSATSFNLSNFSWRLRPGGGKGRASVPPDGGGPWSEPADADKGPPYALLTLTSITLILFVFSCQDSQPLGPRPLLCTCLSDCKWSIVVVELHNVHLQRECSATHSCHFDGIQESSAN